MDTNELKKLLKNSATVLILENGEPLLVILNYDSYKKLLLDQEKEVKINHKSSSNNQSNHSSVMMVGSSGLVSDNFQQSLAEPEPSQTWPEPSLARFQNRISEKESELIEKINKQILALKNEIDKEEKTAEVIESSAID